MARIARGWTRVASVPALATSKRSPARARRNASAIWLRAELWVQRKSTSARFRLSRPAASPEFGCMSSRQTTLARSCVDRLASAHEGAHEFAIYLGADGIGIDTGFRKKLPRLLPPV